MKKLMIAAVTLLTLTVFAKPLSNSDLLKINNYLEKMIGENDYGAYVKFLSATINDSDNLLEVAHVRVGFFGLDVNFSIALEDEFVNLTGNLSAPVKELGEFSDFEEILKQVKEGVETINKKGVYIVSILNLKDAKGLNVSISVAPKKQDDTLVSLKLNVFAPRNPEHNLTASAHLLLHSNANDVVNGRTALTNIVNALVAETEPAEQDFEILEKIISDLIDKIDLPDGEL